MTNSTVFQFNKIILSVSWRESMQFIRAKCLILVKKIHGGFNNFLYSFILENVLSGVYVYSDLPHLSPLVLYYTHWLRVHAGINH